MRQPAISRDGNMTQPANSGAASNAVKVYFFSHLARGNRHVLIWLGNTSDRLSRAATSCTGRTRLALKKKSTVENVEEQKPGRGREITILVFFAGTILAVTAAWLWLLFSGFWAFFEWVAGIITAHG